MHSSHLNEFWKIKVDGKAWKQLLHLASPKKYLKGDVVFFEGDQVEQLCYLQDGAIRVVRVSQEGVEKIIMHVESNALFGEAPFFTGKRLLSSFICHKDTVVWFFSKKSVYEELLPNHPEIAKDIIHTLAEKLDVLSNQSASLGLESLPSRICKFIFLRFQECSQQGTDKTVDLGSLKMQDIASILGVHRITLYRAIKELEKAGTIELQNQHTLKILDLDQLTALIDS